jgi:BirA family transcriptional regulator, biotin operon repressor / biotin---[acetyl-CoA-carboxylase] ligase
VKAGREEWQFDTARIGRRVLVFDELDSTNTTATEFATPDNDGLAIIADFQTAGRGQYGRVWQSAPGSSLLISVVLHPPAELCRPVILTAFTAVAVAEAIYGLTGLQSRVKWPNDLLIRGKKACGLLIEKHANAVILGFGLNLTQSADEFAARGLPDATSLQLATDCRITSQTAAEAVLRRLDREYGRLLAGEQVAVEADWKWRVGLLGRQVVVELQDGSTVSGRLYEMSFDGLELEIADRFFRVIPPETVAHLRAM